MNNKPKAAALILVFILVISICLPSCGKKEPTDEQGNTFPVELTELGGKDKSDALKAFQSEFENMFADDVLLTRTYEISYDNFESEFKPEDEFLVLKAADEIKAYFLSFCDSYNGEKGSGRKGDKSLNLYSSDVSSFSAGDEGKDKSFLLTLENRSCYEESTVASALDFKLNSAAFEEIKKLYDGVLEFGVVYAEMKDGKIYGSSGIDFKNIDEITFERTFTVNAVLTFLGEYSALGSVHISFDFTVCEKYAAEYEG